MGEAVEVVLQSLSCNHINPRIEKYPSIQYRGLEQIVGSSSAWLSQKFVKNL